MRVGADGSWMRWSQTGIGRYSDGLLTSLAARLSPADELVVYYNSTSGPPVVPGARERFIRTPNRTLWNQVRLPLALAADRCDVHLGTAIVTPLATRVPCVPVVYDCLSFEDPSAKSGRDGRYWRRWTAAAARRAPRVVVISRYVAEQCARHLGVDPSRVLVAYPAPDPRFRPAGDDERRAARARLDSAGVPRRYVLHVGAADRHKCADVLSAAVAAIRAGGDDLTVVRCGTGAPDGDGAVALGHVDDAALVDLYRCAVAVAVTSSHEGFGLPVVEALACGTPVVASRAAALPEAGGDAAVYAPPGDVGGVAAALRSVLDEDATAAARRRTAGFAQARRFTWEDAAATVETALHAAVAEGRLRPAGARR